MSEPIIPFNDVSALELRAKTLMAEMEAKVCGRVFKVKRHSAIVKYDRGRRAARWAQLTMRLLADADRPSMWRNMDRRSLVLDKAATYFEWAKRELDLVAETPEA